MKHRGPSGGYDFGPKRQYRRQVWAALRDAWGQSSMSGGDALLMPAKDGDEIPEAIKRGVRETHLHLVDASPAVIATAKWRRRYPHALRYGLWASKACEKIARSGRRLSAANFDFTSCVAKSLLQEVDAIAASGVFADKAAVAITTLRGREIPPVGKELEHWVLEAQRYGADLRLAESLMTDARINERDVGRVYAIAGRFAFSGRFAFDIERVGVYNGAHSSLLWFVLKLYSLRSAPYLEYEKRCQDFWDALKPSPDAFVAELGATIVWRTMVKREFDRAKLEHSLGSMRFYANEYQRAEDKCTSLRRRIPTYGFERPWECMMGVPAFKLSKQHYAATEIPSPAALAALTMGGDTTRISEGMTVAQIQARYRLQQHAIHSISGASAEVVGLSGTMPPDVDALLRQWWKELQGRWMREFMMPRKRSG